MRVGIHTNAPVKDKDVRALYLINYALSHCNQKMVLPTLRFFADRSGYRLVPKESK